MPSIFSFFVAVICKEEHTRRKSICDDTSAQLPS